jgi:CHASE2 domain-containing sensor protein
LPDKQKILRLVLAGVTLLLVAASGFFFEGFKEWFPWLTAAQVRSYHWIARLEARQPRSIFVTGIEIDDRTFYQTMRRPSGAITSRRTLGEILRKVSEYHPAVIALDITLSHEPADDREPRSAENQALLAAIREVSQKGIPVVLTCGFDEEYKQLSNIFRDADLPGFGDGQNPFRARVGFDHAADDLRKVPLVVDATSPEGNSRPYNSFALEIADAYESVLHIQPRTLDRVQPAIKKREFVYTNFLRQDEIPHISGTDVLVPNERELQRLTHRIVLIGGNRHKTFNSQSDEWLDDYKLPPLRMRGMYLQANYIEGLLDDRLRSIVPHWLASLIDLALGALMIWFSSRAHTFSRRLLWLAIFFIPVGMGYVASANLGYVFDFSLPLVLLFLHAFAEHYLHLRRRAMPHAA